MSLFLQGAQNGQFQNSTIILKIRGFFNYIFTTGRTIFDTICFIFLLNKTFSNFFNICSNRLYDSQNNRAILHIFNVYFLQEMLQKAKILNLHENSVPP